MSSPEYPLSLVEHEVSRTGLTTTRRRMEVGNLSAGCSSINQTNVDRLSELPIPLIHYILSYLNMKEVVQTCLLSRSWRYTWQSANNITISRGEWKWHTDTQTKKMIDDEFVYFVDRALDLRSPQRCSLLKLSINCGSFLDHNRVNDWIRVASQRQVKELIMVISGRSSAYTTLLPESLFTSPIVVFNLRGLCSQVPNSLSSASHLRELALYSVRLPPGDSNGEFILRCPVLEILIMCNCDHHFLKLLGISAPQLKTLEMKNSSPFSTYLSIIKICTPKLALFDFGGSIYRDYYMEDFPSLVTAKFKINSYAFDLNARLQGLIHMVKAVYNVTTLQLECFDDHPIFEDMLERLPNPFCNLRCLKLKWSEISFIYAVAHWFRNSQFETLVLEETNSTKEDSKEELPMQLIMFSHVKYVEIKNYKGQVNEQRIIQLLLKNSKVLQKLTINMRWYIKEEVPKITKWLLSLPKASPTVKIHFHAQKFRLSDMLSPTHRDDTSGTTQTDKIQEINLREYYDTCRLIHFL